MAADWRLDSRIRNCGIQLTSTSFGSWTPKLCRFFFKRCVLYHATAFGDCGGSDIGWPWPLDRLLSRRAASVVL